MGFPGGGWQHAHGVSDMREIHGDRIALRTIGEDASEQVLVFVLRNKEFLREWEIQRDASYYTLEANIMPRNRASLKVVEKLGFYNEGLATKYLKMINGKWEDHIHMVLRNTELE